MARPNSIHLTRRDMLKLSAGGAGMFALTASGFAVPRGFGAGGGGGSLYLEAFPTSPLIMEPFKDDESNYLPIPQALRAADPNNPTNPQTIKDPVSGAAINPCDMTKQDCGVGGDGMDVKQAYYKRYGKVLGTQSVTPKQLGMPDPIVYEIDVKVAQHSFTPSRVKPIDSFGKPIVPPSSSNVTLDKYGTAALPKSTIYGFNGTFPGPRINALYGQPSMVHFCNHLGDNNVDGHDVYDTQDFGAPNQAFLTHLHNGHTAPESDGQPHYSAWRFGYDSSRTTHDAAWRPNEWVNQLYLGYPAGGDSREKQSFFWFHDHVHGHTGANVYKGMVGLMPIYDPELDAGDERDRYKPGSKALGLPGRRRPNGDGTFDVDYDIPLAFYDCRLDDGMTPHKDAHNGNGETHPEWWGMTYFRHFPNHGFVGDIFTVNGAAYPVLHVDRRRYRLRFLDASISRIYEFKLMTSSKGPVAANALGYKGDELQGQYRLTDAQQCMKWVQVANEGGLLPNPLVRDSFELWPAKRKEFVVDFTKYQDGTPTKTGDVIYLVNTMKMTTGRMWDSADPKYQIPMIKIIIGDVAPDDSVDPMTLPKQKGIDSSGFQLRETQPLVPGWQNLMKNAPTFELQRGSSNDDPETEWLINGLQFDPLKPLASPYQDPADPKKGGQVWRVKNGGGGWVHPMHLHMEEHMVLQRNGKLSPTTRHPDDTAKEDVIALDPSEDTYISRRFRTFTGPYVAHCHNLAHEDHNMMFGWEILPPKSA
jgi:FtsP/CotA-like multicopper oxidase with cupredoxin domain